MRTETLIVGGGLCGLHTVSELTKRGANFILVEARDRLGGRILSQTFGGSGDEHESPGFDLGPAWFWPGQALMESLIGGVVSNEGRHATNYSRDRITHRRWR